MIIIEGGDNCGKSTLVDQCLAADPDLRLLHRDRYKQGSEQTIGLIHLQALLPADGDRVKHAYGLADRFLASEIIYGDLFRNGHSFSSAELLGIIGMLHAYDAMAVNCSPPNKIIQSTWTQRSQMYDDPTTIAASYRQRFGNIFRGFPTYRYDWTADSASHKRKFYIKEHKRRMEYNRSSLSWWSAMPYGVGTLRRPRIVLVGESPSPIAKVPVPFTAGPAGEFLAETLFNIENSLGRMITHSMFITNAIKGTEQDAAILREELASLQLDHLSRVVALGKEADEMLTYIDVPHNSIPHPMHWKRFHYSKRSEYATMLLEAIHPYTGAIAARWGAVL